MATTGTPSAVPNFSPSPDQVERTSSPAPARRHTEAGSSAGSGHRLRSWPFLVVGLAAAAAAVPAFLQRVSSPASTTAPTSTTLTFPAYAPGSAYAPGGSVYLSQVPRAARALDWPAYAPGGSVYLSQVPRAAG